MIYKDKPVFKRTNTRMRKAIKNINTGNRIDISNQNEVRHEEGYLTKVNLKKIDKNGWYVNVNEIEYKCSYPSNSRTEPDGTKKNGYLYPKNKSVLAKVIIDTNTKQHQIQSLSTDEKSKILIGDDKTSINITKDQINFVGRDVRINDKDINEIIEKRVQEEVSKLNI